MLVSVVEDRAIVEGFEFGTVAATVLGKITSPAPVVVTQEDIDKNPDAPPLGVGAGRAGVTPVFPSEFLSAGREAGRSPAPSLTK